MNRIPLLAAAGFFALASAASAQTIAFEQLNGNDNRMGSAYFPCTESFVRVEQKQGKFRVKARLIYEYRGTFTYSSKGVPLLREDVETEWVTPRAERDGVFFLRGGFRSRVKVHRNSIQNGRMQVSTRTGTRGVAGTRKSKGEFQLAFNSKAQSQGFQEAGCEGFLHHELHQRRTSFSAGTEALESPRIFGNLLGSVAGGPMLQGADSALGALDDRYRSFLSVEQRGANYRLRGTLIYAFRGTFSYSGLSPQVRDEVVSEWVPGERDPVTGAIRVRGAFQAGVVAHRDTITDGLDRAVAAQEQAPAPEPRSLEQRIPQAWKSTRGSFDASFRPDGSGLRAELRFEGEGPRQTSLTAGAAPAAVESTNSVARTAFKSVELRTTTPANGHALTQRVIVSSSGDGSIVRTHPLRKYQPVPLKLTPGVLLELEQAIQHAELSRSDDAVPSDLAPGYSDPNTFQLEVFSKQDPLRGATKGVVNSYRGYGDRIGPLVGLLTELAHGKIDGPAPTAGVTSSVLEASTPAETFYTVQPGDTLITIAARYSNVSVKDLLLANPEGITHANPLRPGQVLRIPTPRD